MKEKCTEECKTVEQHCIYTAETHHIIARKARRDANWFQIAPAVAAAIIGALVGSGTLPFWAVWISVVSAVIAAVGNVLNPLKDYYDHLNAAKSFTALKHDARALHAIFCHSMNEAEYVTASRSLHDRYNDLIRFAPPTDTKSFEEARKRIKDGVHTPDPIS